MGSVEREQDFCHGLIKPDLKWLSTPAELLSAVMAITSNAVARQGMQLCGE
jgi:hypothetical protein